MPAYSTFLLKKWEDYEFQSKKFAAKLKEPSLIYRPNSKLKPNFGLYSPQNDIKNNQYYISKILEQSNRKNSLKKT